MDKRINYTEEMFKFGESDIGEDMANKIKSVSDLDLKNELHPTKPKDNQLIINKGDVKVKISFSDHMGPTVIKEIMTGIHNNLDKALEYKEEDVESLGRFIKPCDYDNDMWPNYKSVENPKIELMKNIYFRSSSPQSEIPEIEMANIKRHIDFLLKTDMLLKDYVLDKLDGANFISENPFFEKVYIFVKKNEDLFKASLTYRVF